MADATTGAPCPKMYLDGGDSESSVAVLMADGPVVEVQERFCRGCRKKLLQEMKENDYLEVVEPRPYFTDDMDDDIEV